MQRPLTDNTKQTPETNIHTISGIRTLYRSNRAAADLRLILANTLVRRISESISRMGNARGAAVQTTWLIEYKIENFRKRLQGRENLRDSDADWTIILKGTLQEYPVKVWTGFTFLRLGPKGWRFVKTFTKLRGP